MPWMMQIRSSTMPKTIVVNPADIRRRETIALKSIPLNQYEGNFEAELEKYGSSRLKRILYDMMIIREFENMLDSIKREGAYQGISYDHKGPAHLSAGQEAASVGQCVNLGPEDFIFGSHRSHGEILAKCFSAIQSLDESRIQHVLEGYLEGDILRVVESHFPGSDIRELAEHFILYGALSEIFARKTGFNRGLGGSMHAFFAPFGSMPNNAIVGGSGDIAVGAALYKKINRKPGIVIANIGDAALACGPVWEGLTLSAMDQYHTLWGDMSGAPPYLLNICNNFYGMGGQTCGETMGYGTPARVGYGVNPDGMHAERVDGFNPLAVADAIERKKQILLEGKGPVLLDTITYRISGHSPSDASSYRSKDEIDSFRQQDSIISYGEYLRQHSVISEGEIEAYRQQVREKIRRTVELATDQTVSPFAEERVIETAMFSNQVRESYGEGESEMLDWGEENPRVQQISRKMRFAYDASGKPYPASRLYTFRDAIFESLLYRFSRDSSMTAYGEENRDWGGAFGCYRGLTEALPYHRLFNTPISEGAIAGSGVGYALCGGRAVVELMYCDFLGRAGDEVFNQMPKWQAMSAGVLEMPLVLRISVGSKYGAQHSQDWSAVLAHMPGLKVMFPATPYDAKGMLNQALRGSDPVIFFESQKLYGIGEQFAASGVPEGYYEVPEGEPDIKRPGNDITIITLGAALYEALAAADVLQDRWNLKAEVIDLRFLNPLNYHPMIESVKKTGKVLLVSDACERGSFLHTVASHLTRYAFDFLDAPPAVLGSRNWITPAAEMEDLFFPQPEWIIDAVHELILPLEGHRCTTNQSTLEDKRRNRLGV